MSEVTRQAPAPAKVTLAGERGFRVERVFHASRERVWRAFTDPSQLAQWWGRGNRLDVERFELELGGHWRFVEHHAGGSEGFEGRFGEIAAPERLVQTFEWDGMPAHPSRSTAELEDLGDGRTRLVAVTEFLTQAERDGMMQAGMEEGMNQSYAALDRLLEDAGEPGRAEPA
jgi:uncharacterized protein YndB with AHSA1/START domain